MILEQIFSHATIVVGGDYDRFKKELEGKNIFYLAFDVDDIKEDKPVRNFKIEDLKKIKDFQNSKTTDKRFIISDRSLRSTVIQNALLKLFEEPTENTHFVFFTKSTAMLLPTVLSRAQVLRLREIDENEKIKEKIKSIKLPGRFDKLERFLIAEDYHKRGLVSDKQMEEYKTLI